jgi:hypothetical protein
MFKTISKRDIKTVRQGDPGFMLTDGMIQYPRAMLHVLPECPQQYREMLAYAMERGWIKAVAHVQGKELSWQALTE